MAKRGHGEGSIYQRKKDGRWVGEITLEDGRRKPFYGKTRKEAYDKMQNALLEQKQGKLATGPHQKLGDYLERWFEQVHKPTLSDSTVYRYQGILNNHILPELGHIQLQKLTAQQVQAFYTKKTNEGHSASDIVKMHQLLHKALANAVRWRLVSHNVCDDVTVPKRVKYEAHPLTIEEARQLLQAARGHRLETFVILALTTGMRRGELLGLKWSDIDLDQGILQVERTVARIGRLGVIESKPKSAKSRRRIILTRFTIEALTRHRTHLVEARLKAGERWENTEWVFCNIYGRRLESAIVQRLFVALLKKAGLAHMRVHDLRHSAATFLLSLGVHPKVVQEILGHSQFSITMDTYSHVLPLMHQEAMDKLNDLFRGFI